VTDRFAATLRQLMVAADMTGAELGRRLDGTDKSLVSRWRSGQLRPEPETVARIADIFGVDRLGLLQLAGWLPGEPPELQPKLVSLHALLRQASDETLNEIESFARWKVQPTQQRRSSGRQDASSSRKKAKEREIKQPPDQHANAGGGESVAPCYSSLRGLLRTSPRPLASPAGA
jgi:transcriptional regulator with XRE-family HTH domain